MNTQQIDKFINSVEARYGVCGGPLWDEMRRLARLGAMVERMPIGSQLDHITTEEGADWWNFYLENGSACGAATAAEALSI